MACERSITLRSRRNLEIGGRGDALDALALDYDDHVFTNIVARGIEEAAREDIADRGSGLISGPSGGLPETR